MIGDLFKTAAPSPTEQFELLMGLHFFLTGGVTTYPVKMVQEWMRAAGFSSLRTAHLAAGRQMIIARKLEDRGAG